MPDLNLNEEGAMEEQTPSEQPSEFEWKRPRHAASGQAARMIIIFVALGVLAGTAYMLNELGIVKLWGPKEPVVARVEEPTQPAEQPPELQTPAVQPPAQQPLKEPPKAESVAKQEPQQEAKPQAPVREQPKPVVTPPLEEERVTEAKKAEEPPRMLFRLKDPIVFSSKPRQQPTLALQTTAPAMKEEPVTKPKEESRPRESAPRLKMTIPQQPNVEEPKKETPAQPAQQAAKQEAPAQPKQQADATQKEPSVQQQLTAPKTTTPKAEQMKATYTVQVYAFREKGNADAVVKRLTDNGYPAFIELIEAKGMTWYTVRIGRYPSASEAKKAVEGFAQEIKEHHFIDKVRTKEN